MQVRDVMTRGVVAVRPDAPLKEAVRLMERHGVSGLPVVDPTGAVVGVLSEADLLLKEVGPGGLTRRRFGWLLGQPARDRRVQAKAAATTVEEAMSRPAVVVGARDTLRYAARLMVERRVNRLPVVDGDQLVGIVTRADIARTFLRPDADIERAIRTDVLRSALWVDPDAFEVKVVEGVARIRGQVDRRSTAQVLASLVRQLDGVVAVEAEVGWALDDLRVDAPERDLVNLPWGTA